MHPHASAPVRATLRSLGAAFARVVVAPAIVAPAIVAPAIVTALVGAVMVVAGALLAPETASAQQGLESWSEPTNPASPQRFALELRVGPYTPDTNDAVFERVFGGSSLLFGAEFDYTPIRVPDVLSVGIGAGFATVSYEGKASSLDGTTTSETTALSLLPLTLVAVLRLDVLPRLVGIPLLLTGKIGADLVYWSATTGETQDGEGLSLGLRWAAQVALELDFFEPRAARALDDEWGINHSFLFAEVYGSQAGGDSLPVGTPLAWAAGLGFNF